MHNLTLIEYKTANTQMKYWVGVGRGHRRTEKSLHSFRDDPGNKVRMRAWDEWKRYQGTKNLRDIGDPLP